MVTAPADPMLDMLRGTIIALVRRDSADLTSRQLGVFLVSYLDEGEQTVRGLAGELKVGKPIISRALNRLAETDLVRRKADPNDGRSVLVQRTAKGAAFFRGLKKTVTEATALGDAEPAAPPRRPGRAKVAA